MTEKLTEYERDLLRSLNGEDVPHLSWGAAMSVAIEYLSETGYVSRGPNYRITQRGKDYLATPQE